MGPMKAKFIDGTPVPPEYLARLTALITAACEAEEIYGIGECEFYAEEVRHGNSDPV